MVDDSRQSIEQSRRKGWWLVAAQAVLLAALVLLPDGRAWPVPAAVRAVALGLKGLGLAVAIAGAVGLGRALRVHPEPAGSAELRTGGLYREVRHPIYTGVLLLAAGIALASGNPWSVAALLLLVGVFAAKARLEEALLRARFPGYDEYARRTPRFVPRLRPRP